MYFFEWQEEYLTSPVYIKKLDTNGGIDVLLLLLMVLFKLLYLSVLSFCQVIMTTNFNSYKTVQYLETIIASYTLGYFAESLF